MSTPQTPSSAFWAALISLLSRLTPQVEQPGEPAEQEVPRAAGRVDHPHLLQPELVDGRRERPVEDELLDEHRRLQQGVLLLGLLGEFLIQVAQEASVAVFDLERPLEMPRLGVDLPPEREQLHRRIAAGSHRPERRLPLGEQILGGGNLADLVEDVLEILPVGVVRMLSEEEFVRVLGQLAALALPGQPAFVDQVVVFHEPHEDAGQHPRHGDLIEIVVPPDLERLGRAAPSFDLVERLPQPGVDLGVARGTGEQVLGQFGDELLEVRAAAS